MFRNKLVISAPFGNYLRWPEVVSTLGTYTYENRGGVIKRLWRVLKTIRYNRRTQSWINKLGLPNPGIRSLKEINIVCPNETILSIHGFDCNQWIWLAQEIYKLNIRYVELNISCPNIGGGGNSIEDVIPAIKILQRDIANVNIIAKLGPIKWMPIVNRLYQEGVKNFHLCNTIPSPGGGLSGKILKQYSLWAVEEVRAKYPDINIIGGGGITGIEDVKDYLNAGADNVSMGSGLFNPFNWHKIRLIRNYLDENY